MWLGNVVQMQDNSFNYSSIISSANLPAQVSIVLKFLNKSVECFSCVISIVKRLIKYSQSDPVNQFWPDCNKTSSRLSTVTSYFYFLTKSKCSKAQIILFGKRTVYINMKFTNGIKPFLPDVSLRVL